MQKKAIILILLILIISTPALAQQYKLHKGDQISISVWGHSDLNRETKIDPDGEFSYPLIGNLKAEGKTTLEIQKELKNALSEYIINPEVNVNLLSYRKLKVLVMGEVKKEGSYEIRTDNRILDVISLAGGLTENAEAAEASLQRDDQKLDINLEELLKGNNLENNYQLENGDQIYIPEKEIKMASIQGEVKAPGRYQLEADQKIYLNDFLAEAGSITEEAGQVVKIISNNKAEEFNLENTLAGVTEANPLIKAGDSVYIPSKLEEVTVLGEIAKPGNYPYQEDMRLANLIAASGNTSDRANLENIRLIHQNAEIEVINMQNFFENNELQANPKLKAGDLVIIGEKDSVNWSDVFFMFSGFNGIKEFFDISW